MRRVTPDNITNLDRNEVFVFGSNEKGLHGAGAAFLAWKKFGAALNQGYGPSGNTFAIPSKDWNVQTLSVADIKPYVDRFIAYTKTHLAAGWKFYVTQIGCGLAGYKPEDIAPLFAECKYIKNVYLPDAFWDVIGDPDAEEEKKRRWDGELMTSYQD